MNLLVFLGNIGKKYERTRHNIGFLFGDSLRDRWGFSDWQVQQNFHGETAEGSHADHKMILLKPHTLMNLSGKALLAVKNFYKISTADILIVYDDKDLPFGTIRYREKGSSGGHRGMADCLRVLGTEEVRRLRIGIDTEDRQKFAGTADFVLGGFLPEELSAIPTIFKTAEEKLAVVFLDEK